VQCRNETVEKAVVIKHPFRSLRKKMHLGACEVNAGEFVADSGEAAACW
jgi:hypothetical protein